MRGSRSPGAMKERIVIDIVHIEARGQKPRGDEKCSGDGGLQCESATVVSNFAHGPEKRQGKSKVKAGKQADPDWHARVPHVFGTADEKTSGNEAPPNVNGPQELNANAIDCSLGEESHRNSSPGRRHQNGAWRQTLGFLACWA